jgi:CubicO group peptidase (beta-lactamase class C family)
MKPPLPPTASRALAAVTFGLAATVAAAPCPERPSWPTQEWPSRIAEVAAAKAARIQALEDYAFTLTGRDEERLGVRTDGMLIVHHGALIYERYARGYDASKRHIAWSAAKSITSALTGIAVDQGALSIDESICKYVKAARGDACKISIRHLLEFGSSLEWRESYEHESYQVSSVLAMLYGTGRTDAAEFVLSHPLVAEPGTRWSYSTGDSTVLATVVRGALEPAHGPEYAWKLLFDRVGMKSALQERDARGNPLGGSMFYATPRDMARFGYLYLNDGCWEGQRLLPDGWVRSSTTVSQTYVHSTSKPGDDPNGWQWWLNQKVPEQQVDALPWEGVPEDAFTAIGHWGQYIVVIPSLDLVIVRTGDDREDKANLAKLITLSMAVAP